MALREQTDLDDGEATVNLTTNNTTNGTAIFTNICHVSITPVQNTSSALDVPSACVKEITNSNKQLTVKLADGRNLIALGATMEDTANSVTVQLKIVGE